ncbi:MAG TPA: hypothetical protein VKV80_05540 [Streptosporangiaceae bacterium]|nr:hypothetical protein [Streptosporangiaceae bacterium]
MSAGTTVPQPAGRPGLSELVARAVSIIEQGNALVAAARASRGELTELMLWECRLAETAGDIRDAAIAAVIGDPGPPVSPPRRRRRLRVPGPRHGEDRPLLYPVPGRPG